MNKMWLYGYEFTIKVEPNPDLNSIVFRIMFPALEFKINDKMVNLAKPNDSVSFALSKAKIILEKFKIRQFAESKGDTMEHLDGFKADGFQEKRVLNESGEHFILIPVRKCEGLMDRYQ